SRMVPSPVEGLLWEQVALPLAARQDDVLFCPSYTMPLAYPGRCVITNLGIYDGLKGSFPWWYRFRYSYFNKPSARRADLVLAISESAKRDMVRYFDIASSKVQVVYPAAEERFHPISNQALLDAVKHKYGVGDSPMVLFAGKLSRRRHVPELIQGFAQLKKQYRLPHKLLIVGPDYLNIGVGRHISASGCSGDIIHVPFAGHDDMPLLYNGAELYVLPTDHEGFSFTIMEAMSCGRAVVTLDHPALREGLFEGAHCAPSPTPRHLCEAMAEVLTDHPLRQRLEERALAGSATFTWERTARLTLRALESIAAGQSARSADSSTRRVTAQAASLSPVAHITEET
ncbi:MAG TPA: glycosyltransferase family 1 protein, partial [Chloroflexota bacterium]